MTPFVQAGDESQSTAGEDTRWESRNPQKFYTLRVTETKEPGVHKVRIDNRVLEITLMENAKSATAGARNIRSGIVYVEH